MELEFYSSLKLKKDILDIIDKHLDLKNFKIFCKKIEGVRETPSLSRPKMF